MEKIKKVWEFIKNFVIIAYILLIIFVTICLLSFNEYKVTEFGKNTLIPIVDEDLEPDYTVGDLVIVSKGSLARVDVDDVIFFYRTSYGVTTINYAKVIKAERVTDTEFTYTVEGDYRFSSSYYIGKTDDATVIPNVGKILSVLESKWGFLFLGVFPSLVAFIYTLHYVVIEIQETKEAEKKKKKKKKKKKSTSTTTDKEEVKKDETIKEMVEEIVEEQKKVEEPKTEVNEEPIKVEVEENKAVVVQIEKENQKVEEKIEAKEEVKEESEETTENVVSVVPEKVEEKTEEKVEIKPEVKKEVAEEKVEIKEEIKQEQTEEQKKKAAIEAKMKAMTEEEKRALIEAKLKSMTPEEKKALIEAKKKKLEAEKNKKGE